MLWFLRVLVVVLIFLAVQPARSADTLRVQQGAAAGGNGKSWATAFNSFQAALDAWKNGDEIWVARGTYLADIAGPFVIKDSMRIYGGFKGTELLREHRDWFRFRTILSADLLGNDGASTARTDARRLDNLPAILRYENDAIDSGTIIDGLQLTGANGIATGGHAVDVDGGSPVFRNCKFYLNASAENGGGVLLRGIGRPRFDYCIFERNSAQNGGGIYISGPIDTVMRGPIFAQSVFTNNRSEVDGAGIYLETGARMDVQSSIFYSNISVGGGGAVYGSPFSNALIYNSTFSLNEAGPERGWMIEMHGAEIYASIFWHGAETTGSLILRPTFAEDADTIFTSQCLVQNDSRYGIGTFDPLFVDVDNPTGPDGFWGTDDDGLVALDCVDKGLVSSYTNFTRIDAMGNPRVVGSKPDIGAYEAQREGFDNYVALMSEIRAGKLVLLYRHGITDWGQKDPGPAGHPECFPGRNLSEDGRDQTKRVGKYIAALNVPLEDVFSSPVCRCWESALYMAGRYTVKSYWANSGSKADSLTRIGDLTSIPANGCRMIDTHDAIIVPLVGATSGEVQEGDNVVLRPDGATFTWISQFTSDLWERYRLRFPDASVGVDYETVEERKAQAPLNTLLYSANHIAVYNVLGNELLNESGEAPELRAAIDELAAGWYAVVVTDVDGSTHSAAFVSDPSH